MTLEQRLANLETEDFRAVVRTAANAHDLHVAFVSGETYSAYVKQVPVTVEAMAPAFGRAKQPSWWDGWQIGLCILVLAAAVFAMLQGWLL